MSPIRQFIWNRGRFPDQRFLLLALLSLGILLLSACGGLDTSGTRRAGRPWPTDARPLNVCPGDTVILSWDADEGISCTGSSCPDPVQVHISSDPADVIGGSLVMEAAGTYLAGPIDVVTMFTFLKTGGYYGSPTQSNSVNLILPERENNIDLNFQSSCSGSRAAWSDVDLSAPQFRSSAVRLQRVCNFTSSIINFHLGFSSGLLRTWTLTPGLCTEDLPVDQGRNVTTAGASSAVILGPVSCDVSSSLPPDIHLTGVLTCDLMTGGGALVAASPEAPTEEATPPGILYLASLTPTTTPTASPTAGPSFGQPSLSSDHFYYGPGNCLPTNLTLQVSVSDPSQVSDMLLFVHLQDKAGGGTTPWSPGVSMTPLGAGNYEYNLASTSIDGYSSYPEAWLLYQFVATGPGGEVLQRSDVFNNVTLFDCGK